MKPQRVLALVHKGLEPPDEKVDKATAETAEWRMEYDVVRTLKVLGHEIRVIGVHDDLTPIKKTMDEFKPTITFNLMEAFDDIIVFDQNVVRYLELLKVPYTGCNPRGLTLSRDKALAKKLMAYHRIPVPDFLVVPLGAKVKLPKRLQFPLIVKSLTYESSTGISQASVVDNDEQLAKRVQFIHDTIMTPAIIEEFIDGRELYFGVMGNDRLQTFPVWEMSFCEDAGEQLEDRHRARQVERQVPEEARHRHRAGGAAGGAGGEGAAPVEARVSRARSVGLRACRPAHERERRDVRDRSQSQSAARAGRGLRRIGASAPGCPTPS